MQFRSKWRKPQYVVRPTYKTIIAPGQEQIHQGLRAMFQDDGARGGFLDTEAQQRALGWSDEERERVEQYLLNHSDFGSAFVLADQVDLQPADVMPEGCVFVDPDGPIAEMCGKARAEDSAYCEEHKELVTVAAGLATEEE
jgi:hypothetical protein